MATKKQTKVRKKSKAEKEQTQTQQEEKQYKLGDEIPIYCIRCRLNLWGVVTAMEEGKVVQVTCRTCHTVQPYHPDVPEEEKKKRVLKRVMAKKEKKLSDLEAARVPYSYTEIEKRWREVTEDVDCTKARPYRQSASYREGEYILHKKYGLGYVEKVLHENAMLVLFREKEIPLPMNFTEEAKP